MPWVDIRTLLVGAGTYVVVLDGTLDVHTAAEVDAELRRADGANIIVDLLRVTYVDAVGLSVLDRPGLTVVADRPVLRVVERGGDHARLTVFPTLSAAIAGVA
jgi:hypothetical protein